MADYSDFYQSFYSTFLTTANGLPVNSMWLVEISNIPDVSILANTLANENWGTLDNTMAKAKGVANNPKGLIVATGVKMIGENVNVERQGFKNTGYIQGLVTRGREGFPLLNIGFIENNVSFVDYVLRPWTVAVAHRSLKHSRLKVDIDVKFLTRTGPYSPVAVRKHFKYYGCCPVSIDEQEYNYSGSDMYKVRQVQFAFQKYEIAAADSAILGLIGTGGLGGFLDGLLGRLKNELQRQFKADSIGDYIGGIGERAIGFAGDLITNTATQIVTNAAGGVQGIVGGVINSLESDAIGFSTDAIRAVDGIVSDALGRDQEINNGTRIVKRVGGGSAGAAVDTAISNASRDVSIKAAEKDINQNDFTLHDQKFEDIIKGKPAEVDINIKVNENDAVRVPAQGLSRNDKQVDLNAVTDINSDSVQRGMKHFVEKQNPSNDARSGEINHESVMKRVPSNDARSGLEILNDDIPTAYNTKPRTELANYTEKEIEQDDFVSRTADISYIVRPVVKKI